MRTDYLSAVLQANTAEGLLKVTGYLIAEIGINKIQLM